MRAGLLVRWMRERSTHLYPVCAQKLSQHFGVKPHSPLIASYLAGKQHQEHVEMVSEYRLQFLAPFDNKVFGIKTKLDNANRVPYPPGGYTGSKAFLNSARSDQIRAGRFCFRKSDGLFTMLSPERCWTTDSGLSAKSKG